VAIEFALDQAGPATIRVLDISGREVDRVYEGLADAGRHRTIWDGSRFPSGLYFLQLETPARRHTMKMALVR
jgi:hypothetical protein